MGSNVTRAPKTRTTSTELRIVGQVRTPRGFAYDFAVGDQRLTIRIEPASTDGQWSVEGHGRHLIRGTECNGATVQPSRAAGVRAMGEEWQDESLPFDWPAVLSLLDTVRAL